MFVPVPPRPNDGDAGAPPPSPAPPAGGFAGWLPPVPRLATAAILGAAAVALGAGLRAGARDLSTDVPSGRGVVTHFDPDRFTLYTEAGAWLLGFGGLVLALCLAEWVRREPRGPNPPQAGGG